MSPADQAEYDRVLNEGAGFVGGKRRGFYIPTIKLNNSDKTLKKWGIPLGNFFLTQKKNDVEQVDNLGLDINGVILKTSYSVKSKYDPDGRVSFFSREFDNFFEDTITVLDGKEKNVIFEGSYKQWKEENQVVSKRGNQNDFVLQVHLYILKDGNFEDPKVYRLTFTGKSMSNWFTYSNGDKQAGIESIYAQGIQPHSAIHHFTSWEGMTPKSEKYWAIEFSFGLVLNLESLKKVVEMQRELDKQIQLIRHRKPKEEAEVVPERKAIDNSPIREDEIVKEDDDEVKIEDVPF